MPKSAKNYKNKEKLKQYIKNNKDKYYNKFKTGINNNKQWTKDEIEIILNSDLLDCEIAKKIGRSIHAIQTKRSKLNKEKRRYTMNLELGNLMFNSNNKNQEYPCPDFIIALLRDIERKLNIVMYNINHTQYESPFDNTGNSFLDLKDVFEVHAYNWDNEKPQDYNFVFKTNSILGDIKISWYKYLGRDTTINYDCRGSEKIILDLYNNCIDALNKYANENKNFHNTTYITTRTTKKSEWEVGNCNDKDVLFLNLKGNNDMRYSRFHIDIKDVELLIEDLSNVIMKSYFEDDTKIRLTRKKRDE